MMQSDKKAGPKGNPCARFPIRLMIFTGFFAFVSAYMVLPVKAQDGNKFNDSVIRQIHDLADRRDAEGLLPYLRSGNPNYRGEALFCFGSIQPAGFCDSIRATMKTDMERVRMMGAWALGQTNRPEAVPVLREILETETNPLVRGMCYDALGKCGGEEDLNFIAGIECPLQETEGQAMGIFRFGMRGITTVTGNMRILKIISSGTSLTGMIYASYYLGRYAGMDWLQTVPQEILKIYENERNTEVKSNLIKAVIRAEDEEAWPLVRSILDSDVDYRIKINILNSMALIPWNKAAKQVCQLVAGTHADLSVAAAEAVQNLAVYTDLPLLLKTISITGNPRSRSLLLAKTLSLVNGKSKLVKKVEKDIIESVNSAPTSTIRAGYLTALSSDPLQYAFVEQQLNTAHDPIVATAAMGTLVDMRSGEYFDAAAKSAATSGIDLDAEFLRIFRKAISTGDVSLVAQAAAALRDPKLNYRDKIQDTGFLEAALAKVNQPSRIEAFVELTRAIAWFTGRKDIQAGPPFYNHPIDWATVLRLDRHQKVLVKTSKGEMVVQLDVTWCPGTCAAFVDLIESGFYHNLTIHRVVPNFVMQDGCPRGDGWGGPDFTIRSEFSPAPFLGGSLGMASSGKDTEGSQWYLTFSSTPHLDSRYTRFGSLVEGMDVLNQLETGDRILDMELIKE
jgi:cyclophilin family peptidyl-prolyl cis-trans isomerase